MGSTKPSLDNVTNAGPNAKRAGAKRHQLMRRAKWITREYEARPTIGYDDMIDAVRAHFGCGWSAAEDAHKLARQLEAREFANLDMSWVVARYKQLLEIAISRDELGHARKIMDSLADRTGMSAPRKAELLVNAGATADQLAHVKVLSMTPAQRNARERELELKELAAGAIDVGVELGAAASDAGVSPVDEYADESFDVG